MPPKTVQQLFNLKPEEVNALTVLAGLEGYRGGRGEDVAAVAANVLSRRLAGNWGGIDIRNIAKSPGQYEAVFDYSMQQLADPAFGAQKLGGEAEYNRIRNIVNDPVEVGKQYELMKGSQSFRGPKNGRMQQGDYMPVPGKSNYYFDPLSSALYNKGLGIFGAVLEANGFQEYKLIKKQGIWEEDPSMKPGVPAYASFLGGEGEERELFRQIFNESYSDTFPENLKTSIK